MRRIFFLLLILLVQPAICWSELPALSLRSIEGKTLELTSYKGKTLLIVNTASLCGFTPQFRDLEKLYLKYQHRDFIVLGFPSNDFGEQDPGSNKEIKTFCSKKFDITFPMFEKNPVTGGAKQPFFKYLTEEGEDSLKGEIQWNFEKFLIDKKGIVRARFGSYVNPLNKKITGKVEELLSENP